jgi:chemotaxis protein MotA
VDPAAGVGILIAVMLFFVAVIMEGGDPISFINIPAFVLVVGGTVGVMIASHGFNVIGRFISLSLVSMRYKGNAVDEVGAIRAIVGMAEKARREGLLALEQETEDIEDPFVKKGIALVVDGTDPELVKDILESDLDAMDARHTQGVNIFQTAGGFAPTLGIIGTVASLVHVLHNLDDPATLGPAISGAFIATFYGVASANLLYLPLAMKLKKINHAEVHARTMIIEGIISIQAGDNPRVVEEKLKTFLDPKERAHLAGPAADQPDELARAA